MAYTELQKQQHIRELQGYLHGISHIQQLPHVIPDGIYGEKTIEAIRQFQQQNHMPATGETDTATQNAVKQFQSYTPLPADGVVDAATWNHLLAALDAEIRNSAGVV